MSNKLSYYDFLANFVPGAFLIAVALYAMRGVMPSTALPNINALVDSVLFGVLALVLGHGIQYRATRGFQERIKKKAWGGWVSEKFLLPGSAYCSDSRRRRYLELARSHKVLTPEALAPLVGSAPQDPQVVRESGAASHDIYRAFHTAVRDGGRGEKAEIANMQFGFYRGLSVTCFYATLILLTGALMQFLLSHANGLNSIFSVILALLMAYLHYGFKQRAIERGVAHVREVFDSFAALNASAKEEVL